MTDLQRRREKNLQAPRPDPRAITPSTRDFAQALDRGRTQLERVPLLQAARKDLREVMLALDRAEALALAVELDDPQAELPRFAEAAREVSIPVLRADLLLEEFQIYESRAAGADAVLLRANLLAPELLARLAQAARSTHMTACIYCETEEEIGRAASLKAHALLLPARLLQAKLPPRLLVIAEAFAEASAEAFAAGLKNADAALDPALGAAPDPALEFRKLLEES